MGLRLKSVKRMRFVYEGMPGPCYSACAEALARPRKRLLVTRGYDAMLGGGKRAWFGTAGGYSMSGKQSSMHVTR